MLYCQGCYTKIHAQFTDHIMAVFAVIGVTLTMLVSLLTTYWSVCVYICLWLSVSLCVSFWWNILWTIKETAEVGIKIRFNAMQPCSWKDTMQWQWRCITIIINDKLSQVNKNKNNDIKTKLLGLTLTMLNVKAMTSHCAGTVQLREESESGIRKWEEMWFKTTAEDGERAAVMCDGRLFHRRAAATGNALSPTSWITWKLIQKMKTIDLL